MSWLSKAPEILANKLVSDFERELSAPIGFRAGDRKRASKLVPILRESHGSHDWVQFARPPGRNAFLYAARTFLAEKSEEWAVVGLGRLRGRSFLEEVFVQRGKKGSVGLPVSVAARIGGRLRESPDAEVIHVHNHPDGVGRDLKNLVLGFAPVTSDADRDVRAAYASVSDRASVRFYLVENGELHPYSLPTRGRVRDEGERLFGALVRA